MITKAHQSAASALRRLPVPIWAPFFCLAVIALIPVIAVIPIPTSLAGHGRPNLPALVFNSSRLFELAELDAKADSLRAEIWTLLEDKLLEIDGPAEFRRILGQARQLLLPWSIRRFQNITTPPEEILSDLLRFINRKKKFTSCAVVGNSGILLDSDYGASIDSHEAVIRLKNAPIDGGISRHVGTKTTISFISGNVLHLCYSRRRRRREHGCFCHPYGDTVPLVLYILHPFHFTAVAGCNSTNIFVTDPVFDRLCLKIVKLYSLRRWFTGGGSRRFSDWSRAHKGERFYYSSGMQAVVMAVGVCERVSLYGFGKSLMSNHHYHKSQKAESKVHDYEAEYEFYRDLTESPARIPYLASAVGKFEFPSVEIHGWGVV